MKLRLLTIAFCALFGATQPLQCGLGFDTAFDQLQAKLERMIDKKLSHADNKLGVSLDNGLNKGFTNASIKFGGMGIALLSCCYFLIPELKAWADISRKPAHKQDEQPRPSHTWNRKKIAMGLTGMIAGLALVAGGDRMTNYWYAPGHFEKK